MTYEEEIKENLKGQILSYMDNLDDEEKYKTLEKMYNWINNFEEVG